MIDRALRFAFRCRDVIIDGKLYLTRWFLTPRSWPRRVFLHRIRLPDAGRDPHDHPWDFWTLPLWGWYVECVSAIEEGPRASFGYWNRVRWLPRFRRAEHIHRVVQVSSRGCWTLVIASRARRQWGFWKDSGWVSAEALGIKNEAEDQLVA